MAFTKFKLLTQRLLSGLGRTKSFFPFYDSENDADYRVSLDTLITFISNELGVSSKAVFELTGVTNTGNNYISTLDISSYRTEGLYIFKPSVDSDNVTTLNVNTVGILNIKEFDGTSIVDKTDLKAINTYLLLNKTSYWLVVGGVSGGVSTFSALTDSPYDNPLLSVALDSKQDRLNQVVSGCVVTLGEYGGGNARDIQVTNGTWYISPSEYTKGTNTTFLNIALCSAGLLRYVCIIGDTSGNVVKLEGVEGTTASLPAILATQILLASPILVGDSLIEEPAVPPPSGLETFFEDITIVSNVATLDCQNKAFPRFWINSFGSSALTIDINNTFGVVEISIILDIPSPNNSKGLITLPAFCYPTTYQINNNARFYSVKMTKYLGLLFCDFQPLSDASFKQNINQVKSASFVAENDNNYVTIATGTVTDPTPVAGKGYSVTVVSGTTTINSIPYSTAGTKITRIYDGTLWVTYTGFTAASIAEVNTGTDNAKGATPLNLETSKYLTQNGAKTYATTGGTSTAYTVTLSPAITAYSTGQQFNIVAHTTNTTTTPTINFNGLGAKSIVDRFGNAIGAGDFQGNLIVRYNGTSFNIIGAVTTMPAKTVKGNNTGSTASAVDLTTDQFTAMMEIAVSVGTTGIITAMTSATYKYIRLTSASATGLGSIIAPSSSYKDLYIWNDTGVTLTLYHDYSSEATAANRILCGANRSWANNTMLHLKYDVVESRWCTVAQDGNTFRALLAGTGDRLVQASATGQESATLTTQDIDFTPAQKTSATTGSWTGVNEITISGLKQGQYYADIAGGYNYECHVNDKCNRTPNVNLTPITTNLLYPISEITGTSGTLIVDNAFVLNNASQVVMALPASATQGDLIIVNGKGAGGWKITQAASQQIVGGLTNTTAGVTGYVSAGQYASLTLKCITGGSSTVWEIVCINPAATLTIV